MARNIVLIGFMGVGKTSVGKRLSVQLGYTFVDTDLLIVERAGKPIPQIFAEEGEPRFREWEKSVIRELSQQENLIIATGGGATVDPDNVRALRERGMVFLLTAKPSIILKRVGDRRTRPMLANVEDPFAHILELGAKRAPFYERASDAVIETTDRGQETVLEEILRLYSATP